MRKAASFALPCKFLANIFVNIDPKDITYRINFVHLIAIHKFCLCILWLSSIVFKILDANLRIPLEKYLIFRSEGGWVG